MTQTTDEIISNSDVLEFVVFCIESVAQVLHTDGARVYLAWTEKSDILHAYLVPLYDVLHTQSKEYIVDDILDTMQAEGVEV